MAIDDEMDLPRLTAPNDRYTASGSLFRSPSDITSEQFDLLAAAWAEGALEGDSLDEFEQILSSVPDKRAYAESFRQLRLIPVDDRWDGISNTLRKSPPSATVRRILFPAVATAAVILALITIRPFAEKHGKTEAPVSAPEMAVVPEQANPRNDVNINEQITPGEINKPVSARPSAITDELPAAPSATFDKVTALAITAAPETPVIAAATVSDILLPVRYSIINPHATTYDEENWIVRGIARVAGAAGKDGKSIDGFAIAGACVNAINAFFGWDMVLDRVVSKNGDHASVNFSSSLLSFSAPAKKTLK